MANNKESISQTIYGQLWDNYPMTLKDGQYAFAQNAVVESLDGNGFPILQNELSNILGVSFPAGFKVVGVKEVVEQDRILWMLHNDNNGASEIGETLGLEQCRKYARDSQVTCDNCTSAQLAETTPLEKITQTPCSNYTTIQSDTCLNFSLKFPIGSIQYRITSCGLDVFFTDDNNPRRYLQFEYVNDDPTGHLKIKQSFYKIIGFDAPPCDIPIYDTHLDCNKLNVQPNIVTPCIQYAGEANGGSLIAGVYQFFIAMSDANGNKLSSFLSATNPIPVRTKDIALETNYPTDRSIQLTIQDLDAVGAFQYYILAVAKTIDNVTSYFLVGTFPVTQSSYTYTGNNPSEIKLTENDIFTLYPYYQTAGAVGQSDGILLWANINEYIKPNLQRVANGIVLQWQTIAIPEAVYRDPLNTAKFRSYMRDEVYAMGVQFIYDTGEESNIYHIPGRESIPTDRTLILNNDVIQEGSCASPSGETERWKVYNTGTLEGGDLKIYDGCTESCYQFGNFSYWESTERYPVIPNIWGDLCGEQIRHHKFPDSTITHIHNYENGVLDSSGGTYHQNNIVFPIGVKVDHDSVRLAIVNAVNNNLITAADAARIVGYRIVRGNRFGNKSIICKGLLYDVNQYQRFYQSTAIDETPVYFGNYPYNDLRANPFITNDFANYDQHETPVGPDLPFTFSNRYTFHSPDTSFNQPGIGVELKLETVEYGQAEGFYNLAKKQAKQKFLTNTAYFMALTAGVVAALLKDSVSDKVTIPYTVKADYKFSQIANGQAPYPNISGGGGTLTMGTGTIAGLSTSAGSGAFSEGERKEEHNNPYTNITDKVFKPDGSQGDPLQDITGANAEPAEYTITTTQGTTTQYFNGLTTTQLNAVTPGLGTTVSTLFGVIGLAENFVNVVLNEMNIILDLINSFNRVRDWCIQYNSIGKYNNYTVVQNDIGVKRRQIGAFSYLNDTNQIVNEPVNFTTGAFDAIRFNNLNREDSLYLKYLGVAFPNAGTSSGITDTSRTTFGNPLFGCNLNARRYTPISSYYGSIKNFVPDQYGSIYNVQYLRTESCYFDMLAQNSTCRGVYGGDTFITRFALKKKVPYFLATTFLLPDGVDFDFSQVINLACPRNYYNNTNGLGSGFSSLLSILELIDIFNPDAMFDHYGRPKSIRDCATSKLFYQNGYIYLYHYGIPYFLVETDYNVDYRYGTNNLEGDFYPHQADLDFWLQEEHVPISEPNTYFYNRTYSKQNEETFLGIDNALFEPGRECRVEHPNRLIYADGENWLVYKANNFFDYPLSKGRIISVDGIENQTVLVRSSDNTSIFKSILRIPVDGQTSQVGNGGLFSNPPQDFGTTTLGYVGTQNRAILHTEYGHIWVDAKRGQVFNMGAGGGGLDEISKDGMKNWFKENLPFRLLRSFPNMPESDIDNNFRSMGLILSFDKRYNRFLLTKLDYKKINNAVQYNSVTKDFFILVDDEPVTVQLTDKKYFKECSWTQSYNFWTKSWVAIHSYKPNYYVDFIDFFASGVNDTQSNFWPHGLYNGSFQVFYGKICPFIIEPVLKFDESLRQLKSIEFDTEVRRYQNEFDYTIRRDLPGFNKVVVYNDLYNSGLLNLIKVNKNDFSLVGKYPKKNFNSWDIEVATANYKWRFNQFSALNKPTAAIPFWLYAGNNAEKTLNPSAFNYQKNDYDQIPLKGQWFKTRLINDSLSNYKIMFKLLIDGQILQYR